MTLIYVNRRRFAKLLLAGSIARAANPPDRVEIGGATIEVSIDPDLPRAILLDWVTQSARAVSGYFGKFPVSHYALQITLGRRRGVLNGTTWGYPAAHTRVTVGRETTPADFKEDWMLTHEMIHTGFPSVEERHHWIEEGTATYVEPIARAHAGQLTPERVWGDMVRDMPQGLPESGDQGLDRTPTWGRTYWGGAMFCLLADIEIRKRTKNTKGLQDALRAINRAGGTIEADWPIERAFNIGDKATDGNTLMELYRQMGSKPVAVDLADLWKQLGVHRDPKGAVTFDIGAPQAAIRGAIA